MPASHRYAAFGLCIDSDVPLPLLDPRPHSRVPDLLIRRGSVPRHLHNPREVGVLFEASYGEYLLDVPRAGRYLVEDARRITVDAEPGADTESVALPLLWPVMTAVLQQRGCVVLRGAAVRHGRSAVLVLGPEGVGTSTVTAALARRGYPIVTDGFCAVPVSDPGRPASVLCGYGFHTMWPDALAGLRLQDVAAPPVAPGRNKLAVPLHVLGMPADRRTGTPTPISTIYLLCTAGTTGPSITPLTGREAFLALVAQTLRPPLVDAFAQQEMHFARISCLAATAAVRRIRRPDRGCPAGQLAQLIAADLLEDPRVETNVPRVRLPESATG